MPVQFGRTTRSLASDTSRYAFAAWTLALVLLAGWLVWFFFGRVTVYEVSKRARLEVQQSAHPVAALIPSKVAARVRFPRAFIKASLSRRFSLSSTE